MKFQIKYWISLAFQTNDTILTRWMFSLLNVKVDNSSNNIDVIEHKSYNQISRNLQSVNLSSILEVILKYSIFSSMTSGFHSLENVWFSSTLQFQRKDAENKLIKKFSKFVRRRYKQSLNGEWPHSTLHEVDKNGWLWMEECSGCVLNFFEIKLQVFNFYLNKFRYFLHFILLNYLSLSKNRKLSLELFQIEKFELVSKASNLKRF